MKKIFIFFRNWFKDFFNLNDESNVMKEANNINKIAQSGVNNTQNNHINNIDNSNYYGPQKQKPEKFQQYNAAKAINNAISNLKSQCNAMAGNYTPNSIPKQFRQLKTRLIAVITENAQFLDENAQFLCINLIKKLEDLQVRVALDLPSDNIFNEIDNALKQYLD